MMVAIRSRPCGAKIPTLHLPGSTLAGLEMGLFPFFLIFAMLLKDGMKLVLTSGETED